MRKTTGLKQGAGAWMALALLATAAGSARAQTYVWDGGGGNGNWGQANNWDPNGAPAAGATAAFVFDEANVVASPTYAEYWRPNNNIGNFTYTALTIAGKRDDWTTTWSGGWDIRGGTHTLAGDVTASGGTHRYQGAPTLGADVVVDVVDQSLLWSSNIAESGSRSVTKAGAGTLILSGNNAYTGGTAINDGALELGNAGAIGSSGTISFGGGTMKYSSANATDYSSRFSTAAGQAIKIDTAGRDVTFASALTSSGGSLSKSGDGALTLSGANTFTGGLALNSGTLILGNNAALGGAANVLTINGGTINVTGARTTSNNNAQNWDGDFTFAGANTWNTGTGAVTLGGNRAVTVSASTMTVGGAIGDGGSGYSLTKNGAGTLRLTGNNTYSGGTTLDGGTLDISGNSSALGTGTLALADATTLNANNGSRIEYANDIAIDGNVSLTGLRTTYGGGIDLGSDTRTLTVVNHTSNGNLALIFNGVVSGDGGIVKAGSGFLDLNGTANTFSGDVTLNEGTLRVRNQNSMGNTTKSLAINGGTLATVGVQALTLANPVEIGGDFALLSGSNPLTLNGTMDLGGETRTLSSIGIGNKEIGGEISNGGLVLAITDGSTVILSGANTYAGATTVQGDGTLVLAGDGSAATGLVTAQSGTTLGGGGTIGGSLHLDAGAKFLFSLLDTLTVDGDSVSFGGFGVADLAGLDSSVAPATYTLIGGDAAINWANVSNIGLASAYDLGDGKSAYFEQGSLNLVVIPEPGTLGLMMAVAGGVFVLRRVRL